MVLLAALKQISDAHRQEGDDWDRLPVSGKSVGGGTPSTLEEYYHSNKEALGQALNQSIALLAEKDRARALKFIESIESNDDGGAAAWKAALVRMNPRRLPGGRITDGFVGLPLNKTAHATMERGASAEPVSTTRTALRPRQRLRMSNQSTRTFTSEAASSTWHRKSRDWRSG
jgi:hypothetical protein